MTGFSKSSASIKTFCIVGHVRPDGDCIGSQLGLALALQNEGKQVTVWNQDADSAKIQISRSRRADCKSPRRGEKFDCVIATDCASFERLGKAGDCIGDRKIFINIDHHESNTRYADVNWVSPREPSCGELIYRLLKVARWPITKPIADLLFTAISTDTGSFQYPTTRPGTFHAGAELVTRGANLAKICDEVYQSYPAVARTTAPACLQQIPADRQRPHRVALAEEKGFHPHRRGERRHGRLD